MYKAKTISRLISLSADRKLSYFDNCYQEKLPKCKDLLPFSVLYDYKLNIFVFLNAGLTKKSFEDVIRLW